MNVCKTFDQMLLSIIARLKAKALKTLLCTWTYIIYHIKSCNERLFILHNNLINWLPAFYYTNWMNGNTKYMMHLCFNECILATLIINLHYISVQSSQWNFWWMDKYLIPREWNKRNFLFLAFQKNIRKMLLFMAFLMSFLLQMQ